MKAFELKLDTHFKKFKQTLWIRYSASWNKKGN